MPNSDNCIQATLTINSSVHGVENVSEIGRFSKGTVLAFDFGKKRIGVAVGEKEMRLAHPLTTIHGEMTRQRFEAIAKLIETWQPVLLVVGLPIHADGTEHELTQLSRRFARRLEGRYRIKSVLVDERYTTITARSALGELGIKGKKQKPMLDQIAAQHILQSFFDGNYATT
ncbi:Holliday junction resolvase RuvX [Nitrosomonas communis]|uniref:Putative pre-16S rRNA nuclease n=1 Tax=Nitrosomonas communis TaxID=44574 RepID=A0A1I4N330_9PROT|nr:Holliday junction resolvase RuvX [Nitrosomonas communis]SFM09919.1 putative holliday junction resolvase [Nitrosomonas communis]